MWWTAKEKPACAGEAADQGAVRLEPRPVFGAEPAGPLGEPGVAGFRIAELQPALIGEDLLGRVEDLQQVHARTAAGERAQPLARRLSVGEEIAQDHDKLGEAGDAVELRPVLGQSRVRQHLRQPVGSVASDARLGEPGHADALAAARRACRRARA